MTIDISEDALKSRIDSLRSGYEGYSATPTGTAASARPQSTATRSTPTASASAARPVASVDWS